MDISRVKKKYSEKILLKISFLLNFSHDLKIVEENTVVETVSVQLCIKKVLYFFVTVLE